MCEPYFMFYEALSPLLWGKSSMKRTHQLIKLKTETVGGLKKLKTHMGTKSLDDLYRKPFLRGCIIGALIKAKKKENKVKSGNGCFGKCRY